MNQNQTETDESAMDHHGSSSSITGDECAPLRRSARRRFGEMQGSLCQVDEINPRRLNPSTRFFHPDVCDLIAQAETCDVQVDNAHGRSVSIFGQSIDPINSNIGNRARRRNGTMQGFGPNSGLQSDHVPKQCTSMVPPRMPVRRSTNESDEDERQKEEADKGAGQHHGDCVPSKPERRLTNEVEVGNDESSTTASLGSMGLGICSTQSSDTEILEENVTRERRQPCGYPPVTIKPVRRLGISNGNKNLPLTREMDPLSSSICDGEIHFPFKFPQHEISDLSLEKMLVSPRIPTRKPSPPMGETTAGTYDSEVFSNSYQDKLSMGSSSQESINSGYGANSPSAAAAQIQATLHSMHARIA